MRDRATIKRLQMYRNSKPKRSVSILHCLSVVDCGLYVNIGFKHEQWYTHKNTDVCALSKQSFHDEVNVINFC